MVRRFAVSVRRVGGVCVLWGFYVLIAAFSVVFEG